MEKKVSRLKRARRGRAKIRELKVMRLSIHRTPRHIYAQVFDAESRVVADASTVQKDVCEGLEATGNIEAAKAVGKAIAERAQDKAIKEVVFDRGGYPYHGRVKALANEHEERRCALVTHRGMGRNACPRQPGYMHRPSLITASGNLRGTCGYLTVLRATAHASRTRYLPSASTGNPLLM